MVTCSHRTQGGWLSIALIAALVGACGACARNAQWSVRLPQSQTAVHGQLVVHSDFPLPKHHRLMDELMARRGDLSVQLGLPVSDEPIHVYLFETEREFHDFMARQYPPLPSRRAFFVESDTRLAVYAHWNDRVAEDLRHEVTHGYLHSVAPQIPLWIDEGLAEYYEVPRGRRGLNSAHVDDLAARIADDTWHPDLRLLEGMQHVDDMNQTDYAEAWAWVHLLLETTSARRELLREYLAAIRRDGQAEPLSAALARQLADPNQALVAHIQSLATAER